MIVRLTGTLVEALPTRAVLDVGGIGYELGVSTMTAAALPEVGSAGVTLLTRLIVREGAIDLYGFAHREERALFDRLVAISGVGPKLALSVLSTFSPAALATMVATQDASSMARVPGVGKRKGQRLLMELEGAFQKDAELRGIVGADMPELDLSQGGSSASPSASSEAEEALLSMGFTPQEASLALEGSEQAGAVTVQDALAFALRRLGRQ